MICLIRAAVGSGTEPRYHLCISGSSLKIIHDPLCRQAARDHGGGHSRARVCARTCEIQIVVARMPVAWAEITQLSQVMTKTMRGTFHQVVTLVPGERSESGLELDMHFEIRDAQCRQPAEYVLARLVSNFTPILPAILTQVPNRDDRDQCILSRRGHGWVEPRWCMDIKTGIGGQAQVPNDSLEVFAVVICKEESVRA